MIIWINEIKKKRNSTMAMNEILEEADVDLELEAEASGETDLQDPELVDEPDILEEEGLVPDEAIKMVSLTVDDLPELQSTQPGDIISLRVGNITEDGVYELAYNNEEDIAEDTLGQESPAELGSVADELGGAI